MLGEKSKLLVETRKETLTEREFILKSFHKSEMLKAVRFALNKAVVHYTDYGFRTDVLSDGTVVVIGRKRKDVIVTSQIIIN